MARVVWDRTDDIRAAKELIPFKPAPSHEDFRPPAQILSDFQRLLAHEVPNVNWTFELIHDWYKVVNVTDESLAALTEMKLQQMYALGTRILRKAVPAAEPTEEHEWDVTYLSSLRSATAVKARLNRPFESDGVDAKPSDLHMSRVKSR